MHIPHTVSGGVHNQAAGGELGDICGGARIVAALPIVHCEARKTTKHDSAGWREAHRTSRYPCRTCPWLRPALGAASVREACKAEPPSKCGPVP